MSLSKTARQFVPASGKPVSLSYSNVYRASPLERISMIKRGVPAAEARRLFADLPIAQGVGFKALNLPTATVNKKAKQGETLSREESERVIGFARLVGQLKAMIEESGDPVKFDAGAWMARWLKAKTASPDALPVGWDAEPAGQVGIAFGTGWLRSKISAVLMVPSVIVPEEFNVLINPAHADSVGIIAARWRKWLYDPRLALIV